VTPMKKPLLATLAALMGLQAAPALAENYEVNLTRKGSNVYKMTARTSSSSRHATATSTPTPRRRSSRRQATAAR